MKREPPVIGRRPAAVWYADRGDVTRAFAVGDLILGLLGHRRRRRGLAERGRCGSQGEPTRQGRSAFQEFPSSRSFPAPALSPPPPPPPATSHPSPLHAPRPPPPHH